MSETPAETKPPETEVDSKPAKGKSAKAADKAKPSDPINVYNNTSRRISCLLPNTGNKGSNQRRVDFLPGNNTVTKEMWDACLRNDKFVPYTQNIKVSTRTGGTTRQIQLVVGKFDSEQAAEEAELEERIALAKAKAATENSI